MKEYIPETELAYAAGLFDGEGHIAIAHRKANQLAKSPKSRYERYSLFCSMSQNNRQAIEWLHERFGGSARFVTGKRSYDAGMYQRWNWVLSAKQALRFLSAVRPYLVVKDQEADIAIEFQTTTIGISLGRKPMDPLLRERQAALWAKLRSNRGSARV